MSLSSCYTASGFNCNVKPPQEKTSDGKTASLMQTAAAVVVVMVVLTDAAGAYHLCDASVGEDVTCVDETVQHLGRLLDQVALVGIVLQLLV